MRSIWLLPIIMTAACTQSPEEKQSEQIRASAAKQADALKDRARTQARPLDQKADALHAQAKQVGGYGGKRLTVEADALKKEASLVREQADRQADAVKEAADARVKELKSR